MALFTRRTFLKTGSVAVAAMGIPYKSAKAITSPQVIEELLLIEDIRALMIVALDSAKKVGASYADVNFRVNREENWSHLYANASFRTDSDKNRSSFIGDNNYPQLSYNTMVGFSVRALVNGCWGFAATTGIPGFDNVVQLGRDAATQAQIASQAKPGITELVVLPNVAGGSWTMPVETDPFTVSYEEKSDFLTAMNDFMVRQRQVVRASGSLKFNKEERLFASTEGAFTTQTVYLTQGSLAIKVTDDWLKEEEGTQSANFLTPAGTGWEYISKAQFKDKATQMIEEALRSRRKKPIDVGRYDIVFDAKAMSRVLGSTIVIATELNRAMGYEANDTGTSFINEPAEMLGSFNVGSPLLNVTTNRSMVGGAATVKWDDEGVETIDATLVKNGLLNDFQTTRESATWIADYYKKNGAPVRSNGCAGMYSITSSVTQVNPNVTLEPDVNETSIDDMVKDTRKGLLVMGGYNYTDQQALNGRGNGEIVYEISDGKIGSAITGSQYLYRTPDFWKNIVAIGGSKSIESFGYNSYRNDGQSAYTISAVPAKVVGIAVTDVMRKA